MKYPRTFHIPSSPGATDDDKVLSSMDHFIGKEVIITEKLDGENTSFHQDKVHARSESLRFHPSQSYVMQLHGKVSYLIPEDIQLIGENLYAKHSIYYDQLSDFFYVTGVIDKSRNIFLSVKETLELAERLNLKFAPILFQGTFKGNFQIPERSAFGDHIEGYVIRLVDSFPVLEFKNSVAKWVRENHIQTDTDWRRTWIPNKLKSCH